jgi:hypothetical protein
MEVEEPTMEGVAVPFVVPKNPPKWPERFLDWCAQDPTVPVNEGQMEAAKDLWVNTTKDHWVTFQSRGKPRKEKAKKDKADNAKAGAPEESETSVKARGALVKLHKKLDRLVESGDYDNIKPIVDKIGMVAKVLNHSDDEERK